MILTSPNHYIGRGQNLSVLTDLAWNEKRPSLFISSLSKDYIPYGPHLSLIEYFFSEETLTRITPHTGGKWAFLVENMKTMLESMEKVKNKSLTFEREGQKRKET